MCFHGLSDLFWKDSANPLSPEEKHRQLIVSYLLIFTNNIILFIIGENTCSKHAVLRRSVYHLGPMNNASRRPPEVIPSPRAWEQMSGNECFLCSKYSTHSTVVASVAQWLEHLP